MGPGSGSGDPLGTSPIAGSGSGDPLGTSPSAGSASGSGSGGSAGHARLGGDPPSPWEGRFGFSRIVTVGPFVLIGGTTATTEDGGVIGETPYEQTVEVLRKIVHELGRVGLGPADVVSDRVYVTDISRAEEVGRAHGEVFADHRPLMTMVEVSALIDPRLCVEIETVAYRS